MPAEITASMAVPFRRALDAFSDDITIRTWPVRSDPRRGSSRARARRSLPVGLTRPLSENSVLRARLGVRHDRRAALIGVVIGAIAVIGIGISLASYAHQDEPPRPEPARPAATASVRSRTDATTGTGPTQHRLELVTRLEIESTCVQPSDSAAGARPGERASRVARDRPRSKPARVPAAKQASSRPAATARAVDDNPYRAPVASRATRPRIATPAVDDNPY